MSDISIGTSVRLCLAKHFNPTSQHFSMHMLTLEGRCAWQTAFDLCSFQCQEPHESHPGKTALHTSLSSVSHNSGADASFGKAEGQDDTSREGEWRQRRRHTGSPPKPLSPLLCLDLSCTRSTHTVYAMQTGSCDRGSTCCISMSYKAYAISAVPADASVSKGKLHIP